jgi:hypothetical protein
MVIFHNKLLVYQKVYRFMTSEYLDYLRLPVNISSKFFERRTQGA